VLDALDGDATGAPDATDARAEAHRLFASGATWQQVADAMPHVKRNTVRSWYARSRK